ncbi:histone-lysine N-methyltransferase SETMAR [Engystomops pustulosus]|uniref:histone-lysine N-methyltransferase SETMAR n=1 Tax=Engystomops pustulosus TaxID=76066 RepID=UPI003AFAA579
MEAPEERAGEEEPPGSGEEELPGPDSGEEELPGPDSGEEELLVPDSGEEPPGPESGEELPESGEEPPGPDSGEEPPGPGSGEELPESGEEPPGPESGEEPPAFQYTSDPVAGPGAEMDPSEVTIQGCECQGALCCPGVCACLPHGDNYCERRLLSAQKPVLECNVLCRCGESCANRETQRGQQWQLQVCPVPGKGWGVRTLESIASGRYVCEYVGEILGAEEARRRIRAQHPGASNYIIAVREHLHSGHTLHTYVDPTYKGNIGRFLNHSCQPNLVMVPVRTHSMVPRLALFAARDIQAGEELCYDYSGMAFNIIPESGHQPGKEEDTSRHRKKCLCGTAPCTGYLPYDATLYTAT